MKKKLLMIFSAVFLLLVLGYAAFGRKVSATHEYLITKYYRFESLGSEAIVQEFTPKYGRLRSIELFIANISPETDGYIMLEIIDKNEKKVFNKKYNVSLISTGEFYEFKINRKMKRDESYKIKLFYEGKAEDCPQIMISERSKNVIETGKMYVKGELNDYNMAITYHYGER